MTFSFRHDVEYPDSFLDLSVRELLHLSQTDITANLRIGLQYAAAAHDRGIGSVEDPTAAGEAAAKAGFLSELAGEPHEAVHAWFDQSLLELAPTATGDQRVNRERAATLLLLGRTLAIRSKRIGSIALWRGYEASTAFGMADAILRRQHIFGQGWDRYGTMVMRHSADYANLRGDTELALGFAQRGLWRAIRAKTEGNSPPDHLAFVWKQFGSNVAAAFGYPREDMTHGTIGR